MQKSDVQSLANETGKAWILNPPHAGGAQPLEHYARSQQLTPSIERLERCGYELICPEGMTRNDLLQRNQLKE